MAPWEGPRYRSWASNSNVAGLFAFIIFVTYVVWEAVGTAPVALINLLGPTVGVWFMSVAGDKSKRDKETEATAKAAEAKADTANAKADRLAEVAVNEHPELADTDIARSNPPPAAGRPRVLPPATGKPRVEDEEAP